MAEADPGAKSTATQKLLPRALGWFRGGAILTFLTGLAILGKRLGESPLGAAAWSTPWAITILTGGLFGDRKSTRLNSSHLVISYAVFCLKKKKKTQRECA